jgi:hypothetical protein
VDVKTIVFILAALTVFLPALFAEGNDTPQDPGTPTLYQIEKEIGTDGNVNVKVITTTGDAAKSSVYFGIFVVELTSDAAEELDYENPYGILISGVVDESPADEAGIAEDDILMEINGALVTDLAEFDNIRAQLQPGDEVMLSLWRDGEPVDVEMTMQPRPQTNVTITEQETKKTKHSVGYGGGAWVPIWFKTNMDDVVELIGNLGFDTENFNTDGVFMNGGVGKGNVGKGFFIGGSGTGWTYEDKTSRPDTTLAYNLSFGGASFDKRFAIAKHFTISPGLMIGSGSHEVKYSVYSDGYDWDNPGDTHNFTTKFSREFFVIQPRVELLYELLDWLGVRAEVGYIYGFTTNKHWKVLADNGDNYTVAGSPATPMQGVTISIGPWFGF